MFVGVARWIPFNVRSKDPSDKEEYCQTHLDTWNMLEKFYILHRYRLSQNFCQMLKFEEKVRIRFIDSFYDKCFPPSAYDAGKI